MTNFATIEFTRPNYDKMSALEKASFWKSAEELQAAVSAHAPACFKAMMEAEAAWRTMDQMRPQPESVGNAFIRLTWTILNWEELYFDSIDRMNAANERRKVPLGEQTGPQTKGTDHV